MDPRYYASPFHKCWTVQPVPQDLTLLGSEFWSGDETPAQMDPTLPEEVPNALPIKTELHRNGSSPDLDSP